MRKIIMGTVAVAATTTAPAAYAIENFTFTFTGLGDGVVSGEIYGLADSGQSLPTEIVITSSPNPFPPVTFVSFGDSGLIVSNGNIVGGALVANHTRYTLSLLNPLFTNYFGNGTAKLFYENGYGTQAAGTGNPNGLLGVSFSEVPEPASIALIGAGLAGISVFRRRRASR